MQGRRLLEKRAAPGSVAGHIMSIAVFGRAERRTGDWLGAAEVIEEYALWKHIDVDVLRHQIEAYWKDTGHWYGGADSIIEELSRV